MPYSDIDLNLCWNKDYSLSDDDNFVFTTLEIYDQIPTIKIENEEGKFEIQFKRKNSTIILNDGSLWYNKNNLTSIMKLTTT